MKKVALKIIHHGKLHSATRKHLFIKVTNPPPALPRPTIHAVLCPYARPLAPISPNDCPIYGDGDWGGLLTPTSSWVLSRWEQALEGDSRVVVAMAAAVRVAVVIVVD